MKTYTLSFKNGKEVDITEEANTKLIETYQQYANAPDVDNRFMLISSDSTFIKLAELSHSYLTETTSASSTVVTPPSPAQVRSDKQAEEDKRDISLDAQLKGEV